MKFKTVAELEIITGRIVDQIEQTIREKTIKLRKDNQHKLINIRSKHPIMKLAYRFIELNNEQILIAKEIERIKDSFKEKGFELDYYNHPLNEPDKLQMIILDKELSIVPFKRDHYVKKVKEELVLSDVKDLDALIKKIVQKLI